MHHTEDKSHGRVGHGIQGEDKGRKGQRNTSQNLDERGAGSREEGRRPETHPHQHLLLGPTRPAVSCIK